MFRLVVKSSSEKRIGSSAMYKVDESNAVSGMRVKTICLVKEECMLFCTTVSC